MKINIRTKLFVFRLRKGFFFLRLGTTDYGIENRIASNLPSYIRFNWGIASWLFS